MSSWTPWMGPPDAAPDYAGTLSALLGLVGRRISVTTSDREGKPVIVARLEGVLRRAADVTVVRGLPEAEAQFFYVTETPEDQRSIGFMLHAGAFGGARCEDGARVRFLQGGVLVDVRVLPEEPEPD